jgi:uncharacterized damage-inducible protein DinB
VGRGLVVHGAGMSVNGMWVGAGEDPRGQGSPVGERATIRAYLSDYRLTVELKCQDLTPAQLATRSVPPSTMSLLGLVRHLARVEHNWFHRVLGGHLDEPRIYWSPQDGDLDFTGAVADPGVVARAFADWRAQIAAAETWLDAEPDLDAEMVNHDGSRVAVRDVLVHLIEEYARHCGHADLLRECIDGRTGQ